MPIGLDASQVNPRASIPAGTVANTDTGTELVEPLIMQLSALEVQTERLHITTNHFAILRDTFDIPDYLSC